MLIETRRSVVAVFPDRSAAQSVVDELTSAGISRENIHFGSDRDWTSGAASGGAAMTGRAPEHHHGGFIGWLENLFSGDSSDDESGRYRDAVQQGQCVVAVETTNDATRDQVVDIMERHDAINVDENAVEGVSRGEEFRESDRGVRSGERKIPVV